MKSKQIRFAEAVNWEWVHSAHKATDGKITPKEHPAFIQRVIENAKRNGWKGKITPASAALIINNNLY